MAARRSNAARAAVESSFEELYRGHRAEVFRAALRELGNVHDAEDVTQAAFVDAYRAVLRGSEPHAPRAWLLAIAENVRRRRFRTAQRRPREEPTDADFPLAADLPHELAGSLAAALAELPADQRRVFALRELGGRSYDEIAEETGASVGAVQMQLFRARRALRERLDPPQVRRRRPGALVPLPGWLTTLVSRADISVLTPRAAGAVGATVLAVAGTTVAVKDVDAGGRAVPLAEPPAAVARAGAAERAAEPAAATTAVPKLVSPAPRPRPTAPARRPPVSAPTPAATAVPEPAAAPRTHAPATETATPVREARDPVQNVLPLLRLPVGATDEEAELPELPIPELPAPELPVPDLPVPPPPLPALVPEAVAGAAGAAGAGAAPLPVPGVPPLPAPPGP